MSRAKNGTRMSHISVMNKEVDSTWINLQHYTDKQGNTHTLRSERLIEHT
jgi:hypothetical protein